MTMGRNHNSQTTVQSIVSFTVGNIKKEKASVAFVPPSDYQATYMHSWIPYCRPYRKTQMILLSTAKRSLYLCLITLAPLQILHTMSSTAAAEERIVNGSTVNPPHKYPFMVSIWWDGCFVEDNGTIECFPEARVHHCGGSVLNKHWVITAGHCIFVTLDDKKPHPEHFRVITGLHDREKAEPWSQNLSIAEWRLHEGYQFVPNPIHDIALLRVNGTILFGDKVTPINLPSCDFDVKKDGEITGTAMGWGVDGSSTPFPLKLQELEQPLVTLETCQRVYGVFEREMGPNKTRVNDTTVVTDSMICSGGQDGAGLCFGDSGGPLVVLDQETHTYMQVGIASFGSGSCGRPGFYLIHTRISKYLNWINSQVQRCSPRITKN